MAFTSSYTPGLIQQSEYFYGTPLIQPNLSGSFSGSFAGDGTNLNLASNSTIPSTSPFPFTGDAQITGSLIVSSSFVDFSGLTDIKTRKFAISSGDYKPGTKVTSASFYDGFVEALDASTDGDFIHCFANDSSSVVTKTFEDKNVTIVGNGHVFKQNGFFNQFQRWNFISCSFNVYDFTFHRDNAGTGYAHASMFQAKDTTFNLYNAGFSGSSGYALGIRERVIINGGFFKGSHTVLFGYSTPNDGTEIRNAEIYANTEAIDLTGDSIKVIGCNILYSQGITSGQYDAITLTGNSNLIQDCNVEGDTENLYKRAINIGSNTGASVGTRNEIVNCSINQGEIQASGYTDIQGCYVFSEGGRGIVHSGTGSIQNCSVEVPGYPNTGFALQLSGDLVKVSNVTAHGNVAGVNFSGRKQFFNCEFSANGSTTYAVLYGTDVTDLEINNVTLQQELRPSHTAVKITTSENAKLQINNLSTHKYYTTTSGYSSGIIITGASGTKLSLINSSVFNHSVGGDSGTSYISSITGITGSIIDNFYAEGYKYNSIKAISSSIVNSHFVMKSDGGHAGNEAVIKILGNENIFTDNIFEIDKSHQDNDPVVKIHEGTHHFKNNRFRAAKASGQYLITGSANVSASLVNNIYEVADSSYITASNVTDITTGYIDGRGNWHKSQVTSSFDHIEATSFKGDGSQLTNLPSSFTAAGISGSFTEASGGFSTRVTTLETSPAAGFPFAGDAVITGSLLISASNNTSSSLVVQGSGSTIFEVQGSQGQLFSITDDLIHSVLEVSDISGDTLFKVSGSGLITIPVGDLTGSAGATASYGAFKGDGSQLTNLPAQDPFPFYGDAVITGSLTVSGSGGLKVKGPFELSMTGSSGNVPFKIKTYSDSTSDNIIEIRDDGGTYDLFTFNNAGQLNLRNAASSAGGGFYVIDGGNSNTHAQLTIRNNTGFLSIKNSGGNNFRVDTKADNRSYLVGLTGNATMAIGKAAGGTQAPNEANTNTISIFNGTNPTSVQADGFAFFSNDVNSAAGTASPTFLTEDGTTIQLGTTSSFTAISASSYISASAFIGDGSRLTNLPSATAGSTAGRVVFTTTNGELTSEEGFTYNSTTNQLAVENLIVTHLTSSFVTASRVTTSGSNIFGDDTTDTQTLIGTTIMSGSAQISGSLTFGGAAPTDLYTNGPKMAIDTSAIGGIKTKGTLFLQSSADSIYNSRILFGTDNSLMSFGRLGDSSAGIRGVTQNYAWQLFGIRHGYNNPGSGFHYTTNLPDTTFADNLTISGSGTYMSEPLKVYGSGSKVFEVIGTEGTLFSIDDDLDGTLFNVKDKTGIPIFEISASSDVFIGDSPTSLYRTAQIASTTANVTQSIHSLSTSSYDGAFIEYTAISASNARAGNIMTIWDGSNVTFTETTTTDIGDTSDLLLQVALTQSVAQIQSYTTSTGYRLKTIIKAI